MMDQSIEQRIENLSEVERGVLIYNLAESHPRIAKQLLDNVDLHRERDAARVSMPKHPFTQHEYVPGMTLCYFRQDDAWCLRAGDHALHAVATAPYPAGGEGR